MNKRFSTNNIMNFELKPTLIVYKNVYCKYVLYIAKMALFSEIKVFYQKPIELLRKIKLCYINKSLKYFLKKVLCTVLNSFQFLTIHSSYKFDQF